MAAPCCKQEVSPSTSSRAASCRTPASPWAPATRSGWSAATAWARRACSRCWRARTTPPPAWSCVAARSATCRRTRAPGRSQPRARRPPSCPAKAWPDPLLLDEPTTHLHTDAKTWPMAFLRHSPGSVIVVSHDLGLLDASITRVLHLDAGRMVEYRGTSSQYQAARRLEEKRLSSLAQRQEAEIKRLSLLAEVMRRQTEKRAKQAKSIFTRVERMKAARVVAPRHERKVKISFPEPPPSGRIVLHFSGLATGYGGPLVFRDGAVGV